MRILKQILYGLFFLSIVGGIGAGVYFTFLKPAPSCFDNIQNQLETEVDCGPASPAEYAQGATGCLPCELKSLSAEIGEPMAFRLGGATSSAFVEITNPSENYGVKSFSYTFDIYSHSNFRLSSVRGETSLYPGESKYIVESGLEVVHSAIGDVEFTLGEISFTYKDEFAPKPAVEISDTELIRGEEIYYISGTLTNDSPARLRQINVVGVGFGTGNLPVSASSVLIPELVPFSQEEFRVVLPKGNYQRFETYLEISS